MSDSEAQRRQTGRRTFQESTTRTRCTDLVAVSYWEHQDPDSGSRVSIECLLA